MTPEQIELARHALGLNLRNRRSFRNRFVAGPLHDDYEDWMAMVAVGDAKVQVPPKGLGGDSFFYLTEQGARKALAKGESLCPEDFPQHDCTRDTGVKADG